MIHVCELDETFSKLIQLSILHMGGPLSCLLKIHLDTNLVLCSSCRGLSLFFFIFLAKSVKSDPT